MEERYRRYLKTTFHFKDPALRASFERALSSGRLSRGPFLEATPVFKKGESPRALFERLLGIAPDDGFLEALHNDRPLYSHQAQAIEKAVGGRNVLVATGTGSGKTECFLYSILIHLYRQSMEGPLGPGVRALVLYPMNALANDQRDRLKEICRRLKEQHSSFRFTFGQYIGQTPEDERDSKRRAIDYLAERDRDAHSVVENGRVVCGELVLRSEMRKTPPQILLTNYSMLEYLLLRPDDSPLFDQGNAEHWRFLVLDEAHQYRGSHGIEMAMLLRRLKQRLREGGRSGPFQCIATSATLMGREDDRAATARFASVLFGEHFDEKDIILGDTEAVQVKGSEKLSIDDYLVLVRAIDNDTDAIGQMTRIADKLGATLPTDEHNVPEKVGSILLCDRRAGDLRSRLADGPYEVKTLADEIFPDLPQADRLRALSEVVTLLVRAKNRETNAPLLSARYHFFIRSLEGAFVSYSPGKQVVLDRTVGSGEFAAFEVALCRECGQHYFVGKEVNGKLVEAVRDPSASDFGVSFFRPVEDDSGEDEDDDSGAGVWQLCIQCGEIARESLGCGHQVAIHVVREEAPSDEDRADQIVRCGACGYAGSGRDPVREVIHGTDGPHAVISTTLYQRLPPERRKVLAFADGRQEAAFFAWYLESSYKDLLSRNLLLKVAQRLSRSSPKGLSLREAAMGLRDRFRDSELFSPSTGDLDLLREALRRVYREFLTDEPRISLEGVGLIRWSILWPAWFEAPRVLTERPWSLSEREARDLILVLLDTMRAGRAVELRGIEDVSVSWDDLALGAYRARVRIGQPKTSKGARNQPVYSWDGERGRRAGYLTRMLVRAGFPREEAVKRSRDTLRAIWEALKDCDRGAPSSSDHLLLSVDDARRLNPEWWRLSVLSGEDIVYLCDVCGRLQAVSIKDVCPRHGCPGTLVRKRKKDLEPNHYRLLYEDDLPGVLRVEEHTAQLDHEKARRFQQEFKEGRIHVLSCSTTFELGVDLGGLDVIFLRNVPPEAFNYAQRVGRAGRRSGHLGFAITYCRRNPHDLYHFSDPDRMLRGKIVAPVLSVCNEKIVTRHIVAIALSEFFRSNPERFRTTESLFGDMNKPSAVSDFKKFLQQRQLELERSIRSIVPSEMLAQLGVTNGRWTENIAGEDSRFASVEAEVSSSYRTARSVEAEAVRIGDYDNARWAKDRAKMIASEDVLSLLSRTAVIPKYGFPVDVVELDTQRTQQNHEASEVLLQRDLSIAISEFAPTSRLVANKKLWTSYGLKKVPEKGWGHKFYKRCSRHSVFVQWEKGQAEPPTLCGDRLPVFEYFIPHFGFLTDRSKPKNPTRRPERLFTTRAYFAGPLDAQIRTVDLPAGSPVVTVTKASPGRMVVLCEGRQGKGFYICQACGAGSRDRRSHKDPYGRACSGEVKQVSLGHEFVTDVIRLQFHLKPDEAEAAWFAYSLAYALAEGASEVLEVPAPDLSATVSYTEGPSLPLIVLYDDVPGGAGLVARLESEATLRACLAAASKRVGGGCGCVENTSCYGCLRSYRNQFAHQHLRRGPVKAYLERLLDNWR